MFTILVQLATEYMTLCYIFYAFPGKTYLDFNPTGVYLSWLVYGFLWVCLDFVAWMVGDFRDGLFED